MKKFLLLAAAAFTAAAVMADTTETLVYTYDYNNWPSTDPTPVTLNSTQAPYNFDNLSTYWSTDTGFTAVNGGQLSATTDGIGSTALGQSITMVDFGGTVGKVWCLNGSSSGLQDYLNSTYSTSLSLTSGAQAGWLNFFWAFPPEGAHKVSQDGSSSWMRAKIYLNVFATSAGTTSIFGNGIDLYNAGNITSASSTPVYSSYFFDSDSKWRPDYWMVYTVDGYSNVGGSYDTGVRLRTAAGVYASYAVFVKKIELYYCTGTDGYSTTGSYTIDTSYTYDFSTTTGIADAVVEQAETPVNVYNIDGTVVRRGVLPSEATQDLNPGFYIVGGEKVIVK